MTAVLAIALRSAKMIAMATMWYVTALLRYRVFRREFIREAVGQGIPRAVAADIAAEMKPRRMVQGIGRQGRMKQ